MDSYRPSVAQAQDAKYESDLKECIQYSKDARSRPDPRGALIGAFGLPAYAGLNEAKSKDDIYFKNGYELTDDCMANRGYNLVK